MPSQSNRTFSFLFLLLKFFFLVKVFPLTVSIIPYLTGIVNSFFKNFCVAFRVAWCGKTWRFQEKSFGLWQNKTARNGVYPSGSGFSCIFNIELMTGLGPVTSSLPMRCATTCATSAESSLCSLPCQGALVNHCFINCT